MFVNICTSHHLLKYIIVVLIVTKTQQVEEGNHIYERWGSTKVQVTRIRYNWIIEEFTYSDKKIGESLESPQFSGGIEDECIWSISLYPKGYDEKHKDVTALFLKQHSCNITAKFKLGILNANNEKINVFRADKYFVSSGEGWGWYTFIEENNLADKDNNILLNDDLHIFCEINATTGSTNTSGEFNTPKLPSFLQEKNCLRKNFSALLENKMFSDAVLIVGDKQFEVHKVLLASESPVFKLIFEHDVKVGSITSVKIIDVEADILEKLLWYIYTGKITKLNQNISELLSAAERYEIVGLKSICEEILSDSLTVENAADFFILGDTYSASELKKRAENFITMHASSVAATQGFKAMLLTHPQLTEEIVSALGDQLLRSRENQIKNTFAVT